MYLSFLIVSPLIFSIFLWFVSSQRVRLWTLCFSLFHFLSSLVLFFLFDPTNPQLQLVEKWIWKPELGLSYFLGVDGISFWLVLLTSFLTPIVVGASWSSVQKSVKGFHICVLLLESTMIGSFLAFDAILFYVFFELSLVPMYFMVGIWGGKNRIYATIKFFIYTMAGSLLMLGAMIYLIFQCDEQLGGLSSSLLDFYSLNLVFVETSFWSPQNLLFFIFALAFAIKIPLFPFHTWLPDAHVEAPTGGSMILAGVMLKMGTYGFLRFVLPLFSEAVAHWTWLFLLLGGVGIIYGALVAMVQVDMKKLVAYSSVSHMGYVIVGLFAMNLFSLQGSLFQMLAHGISTGALFLLVGVIYERTHCREISKYGGLASALPIYSICFFIVTFSSIATPLTNGFVGEFLILLGTFKVSKFFGILAVTGVIWGAVYMLWMVKRVFFGVQGEVVQGHLSDMNFRELSLMAPLIALIFFMGISPNFFLKYSEESLRHLVKNKNNYYLNISGQPSGQSSEKLSSSILNSQNPGEKDEI